MNTFLLVLFLLVAAFGIFYVTMHETHTWFMITLYFDKMVKTIKSWFTSKQ